MEPTLRTGVVVWVFHWYYLFKNPKVGDIVLFRKNGKDLIKRISSISKEGCFLKGDNQEDSFDSQIFGPVKRSEITGKVLK